PLSFGGKPADLFGGKLMNDRRFSARRYVRVAGLVFALATFMILMAKSIPGVGDWLAHARTSAPPQTSDRVADQSKESLVARMTELEALIATTKTQLHSNKKNLDLLAQLNA